MQEGCRRWRTTCIGADNANSTLSISPESPMLRRIFQTVPFLLMITLPGCLVVSCGG